MAGPFRVGNAHGIITGQIRHEGRDYGIGSQFVTPARIRMVFFSVGQLKNQTCQCTCHQISCSNMSTPVTIKIKNGTVRVSNPR